MIETARVYCGEVRHKRLRPQAHALTYRVFSLLVDIDELPALDRRLRLFAYNRFALFSLHDADFGARDGTPLADHARDILRGAGYDGSSWCIRLLAYPRILGYAFNPLSVYYCYDGHETLRAMIYEVTNTFGERRSYVVDAARPLNGVYAHSCAKEMYVSPFAALTGRYGFRLTEPGDDLLLAVSYRDPDGPLIKTHFKGTARALTDATCCRLAATYPLMTIKVIAGIHFEALKLWLKRIPLTRRPRTSRFAVSSVTARGRG